MPVLRKSSTGGTALPASYFRMDPGRPPLLAGGRCRLCGAHSFPKAEICPSCFSGDVAEAALSPRGKLYTYSTVHIGEPVPYVVGYVDLPEGLRLFARIRHAAELRPDIPVTLYVEEADAGEKGEKAFSFGFAAESGARDD